MATAHLSVRLWSGLAATEAGGRRRALVLEAQGFRMLLCDPSDCSSRPLLRAVEDAACCIKRQAAGEDNSALLRLTIPCLLWS